MPSARVPTRGRTTPGDSPLPADTRTRGRRRGGVHSLRWIRSILDHPVDRKVAGLSLALVWVGCTLGAFNARFVLPQEFFYDGFYIESIASGFPLAEPDRAFGTTGLLYEMLGLTADPLLPSIFGMLVAALFTTVVFRGRTPTVPVSAIILSVASLLLFTVYYSWYTKETFAALAVVATVLLLRTDLPRIYVVAPIALYGLGLRSYWLIIVAVYVGLLVVERLRPLRWWRITMWVGVALIGMTAAYSIVLDGSLQGIREQVNQYRDVTETATIISAPFASGRLVTDVLNAYLVLIELIVPIPLLGTGALAHTFYAVAIAGLWFLVAMVAAPLRTLPAGIPQDTHERDRRTALACVYLLVAFVTVLGIFEPDYGSYLRHLASLIPVMALLAMTTSRLQDRPS